MQEFLNWTVDTIREDRLISPWLEEKKYEWTPLVSKNIYNLLERGFSIIVVTDKEREWFLEYILGNINSTKLNINRIKASHRKNKSISCFMAHNSNLSKK